MPKHKTAAEPPAVTEPTTAQDSKAKRARPTPATTVPTPERPDLGTILAKRSASKSSRLAAHLPGAYDQLDTFSERNLAMVPLTSIQSRIPEKFVNWEIKSERDGKEITFKCVVPAGYGGVPHGLDGDLERALLELYRAAGMPANGVFTVTPTALLRAAGWPEMGAYYRALQQGLQRFKVATYTWEGAWYRQDDPDSDGRFTSMSFNFISNLTFDGRKETEGVSLFEGSQITIRLDEAIVNSLRSQNVLPYDMIFMRSITRDTARNLYRLLEGRRHQEIHLKPTGTPFPRTLSVSLVAWAIQCRIYVQRASMIRRMLDPIHAELIERQYLSEVEYAGRGDNTIINYTFAAASTAPNYTERQVKIFSRLSVIGFTTPNATSLLKNNETETLERTLDKYDKLITGGYKPNSPPAFLRDVLKNPEKYANGMTINAPGKTRTSMTTLDQSQVVKSKVIHEEAPETLNAKLAEQRKTPGGLAESIWSNHMLLNAGAQKGERLGKPDHDALLAFADARPDEVQGLWNMLQDAMKPGASADVTRTARELLRSLVNR